MLLIRNEKTIAILMSTYNGALFVEPQIKSIIHQSSDDWTLYIRDDGSSDNTLDIVNKYATEYSSIVVLNNKKGNLGCAASFMNLLQAVDSEYYMFCDQDDVWLPEKVERSLTELKTKENLFPKIPLLVYTDTTICDQMLNPIALSGWDYAKITPTRYHHAKYVPICSVAAGLVSIFNRECRNIACKSYSGIAHDLWVAYCVLKHGKMFPLNDSLVNYRQHTQNVEGARESYQFSLSKLKILLTLKKQNSHWRQYVKAKMYSSFPEYFYYLIKVRLLIMTDNRQ